ncbi:PAS domain S-box protein [Methyloversatilis sp.]|uniref:PAS domain S-box protein n=1 Tax=Methyloversatilis sp. TaxID=2569862 RepID=UPI003F6FA30B
MATKLHKGTVDSTPVGSDDQGPDGSFFRTLLDKMPDGVFVAQDYRFVFANAALPRMLGYTHDEFVGLPFAAVIPPEILELWNERFRARIGDGEEPPNTYEVRFLCKGGQRKLPIELNANRLIFGGQRSVLGIVRDISSRKRTQEALRESEERFRGSFEQAAVGMAMVDLDGRFLSVNPKLCAILGYPATALHELTFQQITHPDDLEADVEKMHGVLRGDHATYTLEKRHLRGDGSVRWARLTVSLMREAGDTPSHFIAVIEDIHDQRMAQAALADSELRHRLLMHNLHAGLLICAPDARITYGNPEVSRMLHADPKAVIGKSVPELGCTFRDEHGSPLSLENDLLQRVRHSGRELTDLVMSIHCSDDVPPVWALVHAYPEFDTSRRFSRIVLMFIDITDRKRLEAELLADRQMKAAALDAMTSHVAVLDRQGVIVETNASWGRFAERGGYGGGRSFNGVNYLDVLAHVTGPDEAFAKAARDGIEAVMAGRSPLFQMDYPCHCPSERQWFAMKVTPMDAQRERVLVSHENITSIKLAEEAIRILANTDALTGLANRRHFLEIAEEEFARAQRYNTPLAVLMADLDFFKGINDRYGHAGGDTVLRHFAITLSSLLRDSDSAGRVGGEEFAVLLPHTALDGAQAFAERLMECIATTPPDIDGTLAPYTLSIGISEFGPGSKDFSALLRCADDALYRAKHNGRNRYEVVTAQDCNRPAGG